eukprot:Sdes_comp10067_c0_seq1m1661
MGVSRNHNGLPATIQREKISLTAFAALRKLDDGEEFERLFQLLIKEISEREESFEERIHEIGQEKNRLDELEEKIQRDQNDWKLHLQANKASKEYIHEESCEKENIRLE